MPRTQYDWEAIEKEYRTNKLSNRELSSKYGASEAAIRKRAKKEGWERDLAKKVTNRTREKLIRDGIDETLDDAVVVEAVADRNASIVTSHRKDIKESRELAAILLKELKDNTVNYALLETIIDQAHEEEEWPEQRRQAINRAVSLQTRAGVLRDLANSMKVLQGLERTAHAIDGKETDRDPLDELLDAVTDKSRGVDDY